MEKITRRLFLRNTAAAGAVVSVPATVEASAPLSAHEQAVWHIAELKRLMTEDGGRRPTIIIQAEYGPHDYRLMGIDIFGRTMDGDGMFRGGPRNG